MNDDYAEDDWPSVPRPSVPLVGKPDWFDELVADSRFAARGQWFLPDSRHRSYINSRETR